MEVRLIRWNKTQFLPSNGNVNYTKWMHLIDADSAYREKARQEQHKKATGYTDQILEASSNYS